MQREQVMRMRANQNLGGENKTCILQDCTLVDADVTEAAVDDLLVTFCNIFGKLPAHVSVPNANNNKQKLGHSKKQ